MELLTMTEIPFYTSLLYMFH